VQVTSDSSVAAANFGLTAEAPITRRVERRARYAEKVDADMDQRTRRAAPENLFTPQTSRSLKSSFEHSPTEATARRDPSLPVAAFASARRPNHTALPSEAAPASRMATSSLPRFEKPERGHLAPAEPSELETLTFTKVAGPQPAQGNPTRRPPGRTGKTPTLARHHTRPNVRRQVEVSPPKGIPGQMRFAAAVQRAVEGPASVPQDQFATAAFAASSLPGRHGDPREHLWPDLPAARSVELADDLATAERETDSLRRLEREQRGILWNA